MIKYLLLKCEDVNSDVQSSQKQDMLAHIWNPSIPTLRCEVETGESQEGSRPTGLACPMNNNKGSCLKQCGK